MPQIGETVWYKSPNGAPGFYFKGKILGETSRSWLIGSGNEWWADDPKKIADYGTKYPKKGTEFVSAEYYEQARWAMNHRYSIARDVQNVADPAILRKIAELIGFNEP